MTRATPSEEVVDLRRQRKSLAGKIANRQKRILKIANEAAGLERQLATVERKLAALTKKGKDKR